MFIALYSVTSKEELADRMLTIWKRQSREKQGDWDEISLQMELHEHYLGFLIYHLFVVFRNQLSKLPQAPLKSKKNWLQY